jgi:hypothetical protein
VGSGVIGSLVIVSLLLYRGREELRSLPSVAPGRQPPDRWRRPARRSTAGRLGVSGQILLNAFTVKTAGGVAATGQLLAIGQNQALFALLGTTYGGDGKVPFALPDVRPITPDQMTYSICTDGDWPS